MPNNPSDEIEALLRVPPKPFDVEEIEKILHAILLARIPQWTQQNRQAWFDELDTMDHIVICEVFSWFSTHLRAQVEAARREMRDAAVALCVTQKEFAGEGLPAIQAINYSHQFAANRAREQLYAAIAALPVERQFPDAKGGV